MASRFTAILRDTRTVPAPAAPAALREPAVTRLAALPPAALLVEDATARGLRARLPAAVDSAFAQAGPEGIAMLTEGLEWISDTYKGDWILHGTGSWALEGILRDGQVRPGGDGMSGEVAITGVSEPDIFVLQWASPLSLYGAAAFAYMNADYRRGRLLLSATRVGRPYIGDLLAELVFPLEAGSYLAAPTWAQTILTRHRLPVRDAHFREALTALEELLGCGDTSAATQPLERSLAVTDGDSALTNIQFAIQLEMKRGRAHQPTSEAERYTRAARRVIEFLRPRLLCSSSSDSEAKRRRLETTAKALRDQFPVILVADAAGLDCRVDPGYPWSDERRMRDSLPVQALTYVFVPAVRVRAIKGLCVKMGLSARVRPLEYFEGLRLVAEAPVERLSQE